MRIVFQLKGGLQMQWRVPMPEQFNFMALVRAIRGDGFFLAEGLYIHNAEIASIWVDHEHDAEDDLADDKPNLTVHGQNKAKVVRLPS